MRAYSASCWTPELTSVGGAADDAVITTDKGVFTGHAAIRAYFQGMLDLLRIIRIK